MKSMFPGAWLKAFNPVSENLHRNVMEVLSELVVTVE